MESPREEDLLAVFLQLVYCIAALERLRVAHNDLHLARCVCAVPLIPCAVLIRIHVQAASTENTPLALDVQTLRLGPCQNRDNHAGKHGDRPRVEPGRLQGGRGLPPARSEPCHGRLQYMPVRARPRVGPFRYARCAAAGHLGTGVVGKATSGSHFVPEPPGAGFEIPGVSVPLQTEQSMRTTNGPAHGGERAVRLRGQGDTKSHPGPWPTGSDLHGGCKCAQGRVPARVHVA